MIQISPHGLMELKKKIWRMHAWYSFTLSLYYFWLTENTLMYWILGLHRVIQNLKVVREIKDLHVKPKTLKQLCNEKLYPRKSFIWKHFYQFFFHDSINNVTWHEAITLMLCGWDCLWDGHGNDVRSIRTLIHLFYVCGWKKCSKQNVHYLCSSLTRNKRKWN
jgi:hypothetical protein